MWVILRYTVRCSMKYSLYSDNMKYAEHIDLLKAETANEKN